MTWSQVAWPSGSRSSRDKVGRRAISPPGVGGWVIGVRDGEAPFVPERPRAITSYPPLCTGGDGDAGGRGASEGRNDVLAEQLQRAQYLLVGDRLGLHDQQHLIDARVLVELD